MGRKVRATLVTASLTMTNITKYFRTLELSLRSLGNSGGAIFLNQYWYVNSIFFHNPLLLITKLLLIKCGVLLNIM